MAMHRELDRMAGRVVVASALAAVLATTRLSMIAGKLLP